MATAWIEEYAGIGGYGVQVPKLPPLAVQKVSFTTTAGVSAELNEATQLVVISTDVQGTWLYGYASNIAATANHAPIFVGQPRAFAVSGSEGRYLSFRANA
jgi:hypothetical protein